MSTEQQDVPRTAWDAVGPEEVRPDLKVAGPLAPESEAEELGRGYVPVNAAHRPGGTSRIFTGACIGILAVVVAASIYTVTANGDGDGDGDDKATAAALLKPSSPAETVQPKPTLDAKLEAARVRKEVRARASRAARGDKTPRLLPKVVPTVSPTPDAPVGDPNEGAGPPVSPGTAQAIAKGMMKSQGWEPASQFGCLFNLWTRESGWRTTAGRLDGPYGIPQANPGTKMASAGPKWKTDAATQIRWGFGYIKGRYTTPCGAWGHFQSAGWY
ncbi:MAG: lytic transglycosylase domain-containing protein [Streptosporangiaceae bacterium]